MLLMFKSSLIALALGHHTEQLRHGITRVDSEAAVDSGDQSRELLAFLCLV